MNANAYSEDRMIQADTAGFFEEHRDWHSIYAFDREDFGPASSAAAIAAKWCCSVSCARR